MKGLNMKRLNGWARIGVVLSVAWVAISSYVYVDEIFNHPSYGATHNLCGYFKWVDDPEATEKAHLAARAEGKDFSNRFVFTKPVFSLFGYFKLGFLPIMFGWVGAYLGVHIFRWVKEGFKT